MSAQDKFNYYVSQIDKELSKYPLLNKLDEQVPFPKAYAVVGGGVLLTLFIFFNIFAGFLSNLIGWIVPTFLSIRALESPGANDDKQWLTYWIVFGAFQVVENVISVSVWFPYYYVFKTAFIVYLMLPNTRGAEVLYTRFIRPFTANLVNKANEVAGEPSGSSSTQ